MPDSGYGRLQHFRAHRASSSSPSPPPPPPPHPPVVADWVGRLSTSSSSAHAPHSAAHQLPPRSASPATAAAAAAAAADDIFRLREENAALRARVAEVEQREEARLSEARRATEEELLERVEASFQRYREESETELEAARREAARARGRVEALQQALQEEESEPAPATYASSLSPQHAAALHAASPARSSSSGGAAAAAAAASSPTSLDARTHRISEDLLSVLLTLQDSSENDPDALYDNVHKAVKQTFRTLLAEHEAEVRHLQDAHEKDAASVGRRARITTPPCFASLMRSGSGSGSGVDGAGGAAAAGAAAQSLRREADAAKEDLEQERQRVAMVCIHMKKSLHAKNARFEQAVMGKADSLVEHYRAVAEESSQLLEQMRAELDEAEAAAAAAAKVCTVEGTAVSTQTEAAPAPQAYLAKAASEGFRKSLSPEDPPSRSEQAAEEQLRTSHEATRLFERDVMLKAQSLLQKYSSAAADPRLAGRPRTLPPSVTTSEAPSRSESGSEASPQVCYAVTSAPGAGAGAGGAGGGNESSLHPLRRHHLQFEQPPSICDHP